MTLLLCIACDEEALKEKDAAQVSTLNNGKEGYADGTIAGSIKGYADGQGAGMVVGNDGSLFIADAYNNRIRKISPDGMVSTVAGGEEGYVDGPSSQARFNHPFGLGIAVDGTLYVADSWNHRIRKISTSGVVSTLAGDGQIPTGTGYGAMFIYPMDLEVGSDGNIYVADSYHYRIRKLTSAGGVTTVTGDEQGYADGTLQEASFEDILGIAVTKEGAIFVTETNEDRIRKNVLE